VRTRILAALVAVFALLTWVAGPALAGTPARLYVVYARHSTGLSLTSRMDRTAAAPGSSVGAEEAALAGGAVLILGLVLLAGRRLSRRGSGQRTAVQPLAELEAQASRALVETDDAVNTSDQELGFAVARFGEHAAAPFSAALNSARAELAAAFTLRQQLDDVPEPDSVRRSVLAKITGRCAEANRLLDEQSEAFDRLQDLKARAAALLPEVDHHVTQQDARIGHSEQMLGQLAARYTPEAVAIVATSPAQAAERLEFARNGLSDARSALAAAEGDEAAVFLQGAESAADQAESLLDSIEHLEAELTQASSALPAALREIDADIADATASVAGEPDDRAAAVARARVAAATVRGQVAAGGPFDALAALRELEQADVALDHALASEREDWARRDRARAVLDQAMLVARSSITAAADFATTRRGGVGAAARTRLAEAQRHFQQAIASAQASPEDAVTEAQHADVLAQQARTLAEQDVARLSYGQRDPAVRTGSIGGGFGGVGTTGRHGAGGRF
jgi:hypothetical protein